MVKIQESNTSALRGMQYVKTVEESIVKLEKYYQTVGRALGEGELTHECKTAYGESWCYDARLGACVDERYSSFNRRLNREGREITTPADAENQNVYDDPFNGTSMGPSGNTYRGNMIDVSQQTHIARGTDPAAAKPEGTWPSTRYLGNYGTPHAPQVEAKRKIKIKL